jgi:uncharacterized membrane protein
MLSLKKVMNIKKILKFIEKKMEELSDLAAHAFGTPWFLIGHVIWFSAWIVFQVEPFPYGLLTMIVSLEAILLSGLILSATDRESERDRKIIQRDLKISKETQTLLNHMHEELIEISNHIREQEEAGEE